MSDASSISSEQATPTNTPVTDADVHVTDVDVDVPSPLQANNSDQTSLEAIAGFFFEPLWQLSKMSYSPQQRDTLFSVFLVIILQYDFLFDYLLEQLREVSMEDVKEEVENGKEVKENMKEKDVKEEVEKETETEETKKNKSIFTAQLPTTTQYTTLCTATTKYYCCCYYTYHQFTLSSVVRTILPHTPIPDSYRQELTTQKTPKEWKEKIFVPVCFFFLSRLPAPSQLCRLLPHVAAVVGEKKKKEVKQLLSFLLCDALFPPSGYTIAFTLNGEECTLSGPPYFNRGSSRSISFSS